MNRSLLPAPRLYLPAEAALVLGVKVRTVAEYEREDRVKAIRVGGGNRRYLAASIDALKAETEAAP